MLDKPAGLTSHDCVARVRRLFGMRRVGHGGTLDPAVTGVLPLALGPATRLLPYLEGDKAYVGAIQLGLQTDSDDLQGRALAQRPVPELDPAQLEVALGAFRGPIEQRPPAVSAVHVQGERAYRRVQRGESLQLPSRPVTIHTLKLRRWDPQASLLEVELRCSAGTYVRALARDLGERLGCGGALAWLRRTAALGFTLAQAIPLEELEALERPPLLDPLAALDHVGRHALAPDDLHSWRCGRSLADPLARPQGDLVAVLDPLGSWAGIARADGAGRLLPRLVLDAAG